MRAPQPTTATPTPRSPAETAAALEHGFVLRWWQATSFVQVAGPDAPSLLDGLCTQAVERIDPGHARLGLFLDAKAKVIAPAIVHRIDDAPWTNPRRGDQVDAAPMLLVETLPDLVAPLTAHLSRYRLRAQATIEPVELGSVALVGDGDTVDVPDAGAGAWTLVDQPGRRTRALLADHDTCAALVAGLAEHCADPDTLEADRITAGIASLHDLLPGRMPAEVGGMDAAVALDAGCYLGQEPVARLHYRGHANRTLRRLATEPGADLSPTAGDPDEALALRRVDADPGSRAVGRLTTWARDRDGRIVALAVLRRELQVGEELQLADGQARLRIVDSAPS